MGSQERREGGDITAADMVGPSMEPSEITAYYEGTTIFITGATGFLGRLLVEKLLRTCGVSRIYALVRTKKGKSYQERRNEYFDSPIFEPLKRKDPDALKKFHTISGDCSVPGLGLTAKDKQKIIFQTNCVFHLAATVRFDEKLKKAVDVNVKAMREVLEMAKEMTHLMSFIHVSTAYSNCPRAKVDETFYEPPIQCDKLLNVTESLEDDILESIVPTLLGEWPNTYSYTKAVAEDVVRTNGTDLPIAIVRPSMVIATAKEPVAGWTDNFYGPTALFVGLALGLLRVAVMDREHVADLVPADYVVNCILATGWDVGTSKKLNENQEVAKRTKSDIPIYNYVGGNNRAISWGRHEAMANQHMAKNPSILQVWHQFYFITTKTRVFEVLHLILHLFPAYVIDFLAGIAGKKIGAVKGYEKFGKINELLTYFSTGQWFFQSKRTQRLWEKLNENDKRQFEFDMGALDWDSYYHTTIRGGRVYLLKDPLDTIPAGLSKRVKLRIIHYFAVCLLIFLLYKFLCLILNVLT